MPRSCLSTSTEQTTRGIHWCLLKRKQYCMYVRMYAAKHRAIICHIIYTSLNLYPTSLHPYTFTNLYTPLTLSWYYHKSPWHYHKSLHPYTHTTTKQTWIDTALVRHNYNRYSRLPPPPSCTSLVSFSLAHTRIYIVSPPVPLYPPSFYLSLSLSLSLSRPPPFPCLNF